MVPAGPGRCPAGLKTVLKTSKAISSMALLGMTLKTSAEKHNATVRKRLQVFQDDATTPLCLCTNRYHSTNRCRATPAALPPKNAVTPPSRHVSEMISIGFACRSLRRFQHM